VGWRKVCIKRSEHDLVDEMEFNEEVFKYFTEEEAFEFSLIMEWATHGNYQETILNRYPERIYEWVLKVAKRLMEEGKVGEEGKKEGEDNWVICKLRPPVRYADIANIVTTGRFYPTEVVIDVEYDEERGFLIVVKWEKQKVNSN